VCRCVYEMEVADAQKCIRMKECDVWSSCLKAIKIETVLYYTGEGESKRSRCSQEDILKSGRKLVGVSKFSGNGSSSALR
jgi:hypothetical protein